MTAQLTNVTRDDNTIMVTVKFDDTGFSATKSFMFTNDASETGAQFRQRIVDSVTATGNNYKNLLTKVATLTAQIGTTINI